VRSLVESLLPDHLAARLPEVRAKHRALGLTDDESRATLRDVFRAHEIRGEEPFADLEWIEVVWGGRLAELGRLQFESRKNGVLAVHIPESGPLTPAACDASFRRARDVFGEHHVASCHSWLLDPQLAEVLPADSNIVQFQRRFELTDEGGDGNADVLRFVFHTSDPALDKLVPTTTLERSLLEHMREGGRWRAPTGVTSLR
jgi:GNAT domain-containint protein